MRAQQFFHDIAELRWTIFGHEASVTNWQVMVFEHFFGQIPIQDVPAAGFVRCMLLKVFGEQFRDLVSATTGLARDGDGEFSRRILWRWESWKDGTELGTDNRRTFI
jgi:hypothetical protein